MAAAIFGISLYNCVFLEGGEALGHDNIQNQNAVFPLKNLIVGLMLKRLRPGMPLLWWRVTPTDGIGVLENT